MKNLLITTLLIWSVSFTATGQEDIVLIIDELTEVWDKEAVSLKTYKGFMEYCRTSAYRISTVNLLNKIHHYDTLLYQTVTNKHNLEKDVEAKKAIDDILTLETDYTTRSFLRFLHTECDELNYIENNLAKAGGVEFDTEVSNLEEALGKYVAEITKQIDLIDIHVHHLKGL